MHSYPLPLCTSNVQNNMDSVAYPRPISINSILGGTLTVVLIPLSSMPAVSRGTQTVVLTGISGPRELQQLSCLLSSENQFPLIIVMV